MLIFFFKSLATLPQDCVSAHNSYGSVTGMVSLSALSPFYSFPSVHLFMNGSCRALSRPASPSPSQPCPCRVTSTSQGVYHGLFREDSSLQKRNWVPAVQIIYFFSPCSKLSDHYASGLANDTISDAVANCILLMLNEPTDIHFNVVTDKWNGTGVTKL